MPSVLPAATPDWRKPGCVLEDSVKCILCNYRICAEMCSTHDSSQDAVGSGNSILVKCHYLNCVRLLLFV